ncbi:hypothetical protein TNIN_265901 [Trichonephila inaurata madagascariensis]|uniref:Uncharacterized protein n=1 Tax=Trichonephila inaurata madagascariensis TaxID=2747483 RepID=A0A8X7CGM4_9ARAC|nr:hypothetical protein TNIN_265901 [Trichonephila inaurata madagascariensis]
MNDPVGSPKQTFIVEDKKLSSDSSVGNAFAQHFCGANSKNTYARKHSSGLKIQHSYSRNLNLWYYSVIEAPITQNEMAYALKSLPCGISSGGDGIHSKFLSHLGPRAFKTVSTGVASSKPISLTSITGMEKLVDYLLRSRRGLETPDLITNMIPPELICQSRPE